MVRSVREELGCCCDELCSLAGCCSYDRRRRKCGGCGLEREGREAVSGEDEGLCAGPAAEEEENQKGGVRGCVWLCFTSGKGKGRWWNRLVVLVSCVLCDVRL